MNKISRLARKLALLALLFVITVAFSWKLVLPGQFTSLDGPDIVSQVIPWLQAQAVQWHAGRFPVWDPHLWAGQPMVAQVQPGTLNPLNWILFSMPLKDGFIQIPVLHWYWVSIQFLAVLFCFWLCRDLGLSPTASVFGGCAFGLGGFVGAIGWPQFMLSAVLLPLILMFFLRVLRQENVLPNAAASGALLGVAFLSGHHNVPTFFTLAMIGLWIYYFALLPQPFHWRAAAPAITFFVCFALIAAAQILPSYEMGRLSLRWVGAPNPIGWDEKVPLAAIENFSVYPTAILGVVIQGFQHASQVFIGLVAVTLALLGAAARWQLRSVRILAGVALGGLIFSLGARSLFHGILYALIPSLDKARSPSTAEAIFHLGIVVLAAYGVDSFRSSHASQSANRLSIRLLSFAALFLWAALVVLITVRPEKSEEYKFLAQAAFVAILLAGILLAWNCSGLSNRAAGACLILLLLFELNSVTTYGYRPLEAATTLHKLSEHNDIAAFLRQTANMARVEIDDTEIPYNFGDWFGIDQLVGNQPGVLKSIAASSGEPRFLTIFATNYFIGKTPRRPDQKEVFQARSGLKVFENPGVLPRARIVHSAISAPDDVAVIQAVADGATDLSRTVVLPGATPTLETCDGGSVQIQLHRPTRVVLRSDAPCKSMLVLADAWYPGWKAFVDGKPAQIWKAYNVVRGVVVDSGQHEVVMVYRPLSVFIGAALALLGILLAVVLRIRFNAPLAATQTSDQT